MKISVEHKDISYLFASKMLFFLLFLLMGICQNGIAQTNGTSTNGGGGVLNKENGLSPATSTLRANLYSMLTGKPILLDGVISCFHSEYCDSIDMWDATKMTNPYTENMGIISNGKVLAIERKSMPKNGDTIFYKMNNYKIAPYCFKLIADKLDLCGQDAYLYDKYLNLLKPIHPNDTTIYDFDIKSPSGSWDENRFSILFKAAFTTPVTITNVKAYTQNKNIVVEWGVENESNMQNYTIEKSTDGKTFTKGGTIAAKNANATTYQWVDAYVAEGYHYYRILSTELDGQFSYSKIVRVLVGNSSQKGKINIYPNPVKDGLVNLQFENQEAGIYQLHLFNNMGQMLMSKTITHSGGSSSELLKLNSIISKGIYNLEIMRGSERVMIEKVVY
jgi:hypothetical protein